MKLRAQAQLTIAAICLEARRRAVEQGSLASQTIAGRQTNAASRPTEASQGGAMHEQGTTFAVPAPTISTLYEEEGEE